MKIGTEYYKKMTERVLLRLRELRGSTHVEVGGVGIVHTVAGAIGLNQVPARWQLRDFQTDRACVLRRELFLIENLVIHPGGRQDRSRTGWPSTSSM